MNRKNNPIMPVLWLYYATGTVIRAKFSSIETARLIWMKRDDDVVGGCIDIAFGQQPAPKIGAFQDRDATVLYVTDRAKELVRPHTDLRTADGSIDVEGEVTWLVAEWNERQAPTEYPAAILNDDWMVSYLEEYELDAAQFAELGIWNDETYVSNESSLPMSARLRSGKHRLTRLDASSQPYDVMREIAPPWLHTQPIDRMILPARIKSMVKRYNYTMWSEILEQSESELLKLANFGKRSIVDLANLIRQISTGELRPSLEFPVSNASESKGVEYHEVLGTIDGADLRRYDRFSDLFETLLTTALTERERDVLCSYLGYKTDVHTLEEIATRLALSRERVRQVLARTAEAIQKSAIASERIFERITALVFDSPEGLPIAQLHIHDPWFDDQVSEKMIRFFVSKVWKNELRVAECGEKAVLLPWTEQKPVELIAEVKSVLLDLASQRVPADGLEQIVLDQFLDIHPIVVRYVITQCGSQLQLATDHTTGNVCLVGFGGTLDDHIRAILEDSPRAMTCAEIESELLRRGYDYATSSIQSHTNKIAIRCSPGYFGLRHHLPLTDEQINEVGNHVANVLATNPDHQWHFDEVKRQLETSYPIDALRLDSVALIDLLDSVGMVTKLGYHALRYRYQGDGEIPTRRLKLVETVVGILEEHGGPMGVAALREELATRRGISNAQQIFYSDRIVALRRGLVGLVDRDLDIEPEGLEYLLEQLRAAQEDGVRIDSDEAVKLARQILGSALDELDNASVSSLIRRLDRGTLNLSECNSVEHVSS